MAVFQLYKLRFPSGLHLDDGGYGLETSAAFVHSDKFFSAICCCANALGGGAWVDTLCDAAAISSAFPFSGDVLFFPKPKASGDHVFLPDYPSEKKFKKLLFLSQNRLKDWFLGGSMSFLESDVRNSCWFDSGKAIFEIFKTIERPRVVIDRTTAQTTIFHFTEVHFEKNCGLFLLANFKNESAQKIFEASLRLLGDEGIGADGTVGKGWFEIVSPPNETFTLDLKTDGKIYLLSLYNPKPDEVKELDPTASDYEILTRRGWISAVGGMDLRRQSLRMFSEGSLLVFKDGLKPVGRIATVLDKKNFGLEHDIFRNGKLLSIG